MTAVGRESMELDDDVLALIEFPIFLKKQYTLYLKTEGVEKS